MGEIEVIIDMRMGGGERYASNRRDAVRDGGEIDVIVGMDVRS